MTSESELQEDGQTETAYFFKAANTGISGFAHPNWGDAITAHNKKYSGARVFRLSCCILPYATTRANSDLTLVGCLRLLPSWDGSLCTQPSPLYFAAEDRASLAGAAAQQMLAEQTSAPFLTGAPNVGDEHRPFPGRDRATTERNFHASDMHLLDLLAEPTHHKVHSGGSAIGGHGAVPIQWTYSNFSV